MDLFAGKRSSVWISPHVGIGLQLWPFKSPGAVWRPGITKEHSWETHWELRESRQDRESLSFLLLVEFKAISQTHGQKLIPPSSDHGHSPYAAAWLLTDILLPCSLTQVGTTSFVNGKRPWEQFAKWFFRSPGTAHTGFLHLCIT